MSENGGRSGWFDARMSIGNLITIVLVIFGVVGGWYRLGERITILEQQAKRTDVIIERLDRERDDIKVRVIRIEEKISGQNDTLQRILRNVESRDWRPDQP